MTYIFDHIFKSGGTTFHSSYLPAAFPPGESIVLRGFAEENREDLERLARLPDEEKSRIQIIAGHNAGRLRPHFPHARFITLVRDPVQRAISAYLHAKYHGDAYAIAGAEIREKQIGLGEFVEQDLFAARYAEFVSVHDWQAKVLLGPEDAGATLTDAAGLASRIGRRFHLAGYTERLELFLFVLHVSEGFPLVLFNNRLVRKERSSFRATAGDVEVIERWNRQDRAVYDCVRRQFDRRAAEVCSGPVWSRYQQYLDALERFRRETGGDENVLPVLYGGGAA